ncbi:MAG: GAF domain-containing protein [Bernardetiaceae bacterium]|nr:GAF domain-containing protein [Bernardetiaceae bacterium]
MIAPPIPINEKERQHKLDSLEILNTPPEPEFDAITEVVARILNVPISLVSLIDNDRQWFKSKFGVDIDETSREVSFCAHAINYNEVFVIENALEDERFFDNPFVVDEKAHIRFYAGAQLTTSDGYNLGTLCAVDRIPRKISQEDKQLLAKLARHVVTVMELKAYAKAVREALQDLKQLYAQAASEFESKQLQTSLEAPVKILTVQLIQKVKRNVTQTLSNKKNKIFCPVLENFQLVSLPSLLERTLSVIALLMNEFLDNEIINLKVNQERGAATFTFRNSFVATWAKYNKLKEEELTEKLLKSEYYRQVTTYVASLRGIFSYELSPTKGITMELQVPNFLNGSQ